MASWVYQHQDLDDAPYADGPRVVRPTVPLIVLPGIPSLLGVLDSGSPVSVADTTLFE